MEEIDQDRLSSLPNIILHCILSRLPEKDAARTSVLSKAWLDTWYTFPILSFCTSKIMEKSPAQPMENSERMRKILGFCDYVKRRLLRFHDQSLAIKEFKLKLDCFGLDHISNDVDIWLKLAYECGVKVIEYYSKYVSVSQDQYHVLPKCVIEAKSLTKLVLDGFIKIDSTFTNHSIKFFSLRVLSLHCVLLGDQHAINNLLSFCPLIESITLSYCYVLGSGDGTKAKLKSLSISGLQKLKSVNALGIQDVLTSLYIYIDGALNEDALDPHDSSPPPSIKHLTINKINIPNKKYLFSSVVNILLSWCCLETIRLRVSSCSKEFIEWFYETLMTRKEDECFCASNNIRCWWHGLKSVKVTGSIMNMVYENVDFRTMLELLPTFACDETIIFMLDF